MMLLESPFDPLNSFMAPFLLKGPPNLLDFYRLNCRKSKNLKIRHCLIDQATARSIDQAAARSKSGRCLINQAATKVKLGGCLINWAAARWKSGSCLIDQAAA